MILVVDDTAGGVVSARSANREILTDLLNDMRQLVGSDADDSGDLAHEETDTDWGDFVLVRSEDGQVTYIDPERYWDGIATWFRAHGDDPHRWRSRPVSPA